MVYYTHMPLGSPGGNADQEPGMNTVTVLNIDRPNAPYVTLDINACSTHDLELIRFALVDEVEDGGGDTSVPRIAECVASIERIDAVLRRRRF